MGAGKSLSYVTAALATGKRVAVLTQSKGLQDQVYADFCASGLYDMRGLQNYTCRALTEGGHFESLWMKRWGRPTCDVGPCTAGLRCDLKDNGCDYFDDYRKTCEENLVSTNYAYWIAIHKYGQGLGKFDMLVLDEAHCSDGALSSAMSVEFTAKDLKELHSVTPSVDAPLRNWRMWGRVQLQRIQGRLDFFASGARIGQKAGPNGTIMLVQDTDLPDAAELKFWKKLEGKCQTLSESTDDWIIETDEFSGNIRIAPAWVRQYVETHLFLNIPRVVLMSATVRPKIIDLLGIPQNSYEFTEYPSTFPVERRPFYWIPTVALNHYSPDEDLRTWAVRIDQIIARRMDRKGIVHTVSYDRARYLMEHSRFRHIMMSNTSSNTRDIVQSFRNAAAPAVLVSPSVGTGYDFPYNYCRYQIIGKVPFRDARGAILRVQAKEDPDYLNYLTAQDVIQTYGRSNRCFSRDTELLTTSGWKKWYEVSVGDTAYGVPVGVFRKTRRQFHSGALPLIENEVTAVNTNDAPERMINLKAKALDAMVTSNHEMVVQTIRITTHTSISTKPYGKKKYTQKNSYKLLTSGIKKLRVTDLPERFKLSCAGKITMRKGPNIANSLVKSRDWFRLMGIIISDGNISTDKCYVNIYQSKPAGIVWIDALLERLEIKYKKYTISKKGTVMSVGGGKEYIRNYDGFVWHITGHDASRIRDVFHRGWRRRKSVKRAYRQRQHTSWDGGIKHKVDGWKDVERAIPRWVLQRASCNQMVSLLEGMMRGDGSWFKLGSCGAYYTSELSLANSTQELLALIGFRSSLVQRDGQYEVGFACSGFVDCPKETVVSDGPVEKSWCPTTELGTVLVRRNGKTFIAGNSPNDFSETFCLDNHIEWFLSQHAGYIYDKDLGRFNMRAKRENKRDFFPEYVVEAFQRLNGVPDPPPLDVVI